MLVRPMCSCHKEYGSSHRGPIEPRNGTLRVGRRQCYSIYIIRLRVLVNQPGRLRIINEPRDRAVPDGLHG